MTTLVIVVVMAGCVFAVRLSGFIAAKATIPAAWERTLGYVPIATLTALVVASVSGRSNEMSLGIVAVGLAAGISYLTRKTWACIVGGMLVYWLLQFVA
ncbi:MAG TPA: AzlD domain-containing protein [Thermomicrobiales bacterium]|nr:AzlD domain-containing protein [Thermomicrobiales bacterium]